MQCAGMGLFIHGSLWSRPPGALSVVVFPTGPTTTGLSLSLSLSRPTKSNRRSSSSAISCLQRVTLFTSSVLSTWRVCLYLSSLHVQPDLDCIELVTGFRRHYFSPIQHSFSISYLPRVPFLSVFFFGEWLSCLYWVRPILDLIWSWLTFETHHSTLSSLISSLRNVFYLHIRQRYVLVFNLLEPDWIVNRIWPEWFLILWLVSFSLWDALWRRSSSPRWCVSFVWRLFSASDRLNWIFGTRKRMAANSFFCRACARRRRSIFCLPIELSSSDVVRKAPRERRHAPGSHLLLRLRLHAQLCVPQ